MSPLTCSFCGPRSPRHQRFMSGLAGYAICDHCAKLMVSLLHDRFPPPGVTVFPGVSCPLEGEETERTRHEFAEIVCRFCGRRRTEFGPGGVAGTTPATFIGPDCINRAAAELLAS